MRSSSLPEVAAVAAAARLVGGGFGGPGAGGFFVFDHLEFVAEIRQMS